MRQLIEYRDAGLAFAVNAGLSEFDEAFAPLVHLGVEVELSAIAVDLLAELTASGAPYTTQLIEIETECGYTEGIDRAAFEECAVVQFADVKMVGALGTVELAAVAFANSVLVIALVASMTLLPSLKNSISVLSSTKR